MSTIHSISLIIIFAISSQLNLRALVRNEMTELFDIIDNENFTYPGTMDTRDLMHLQDFQKCILAKNFGFLGHFVKLKMEQYLSRSFVTRQIERPGKFLHTKFLFIRIQFFVQFLFFIRQI